MRQTTLFLIRHGTTDWNEAGRLQGHSDIPLNARGRRDALAAARRLAAAGIVPAAVYSSDLIRAAETARLIAARRGRRVPVRLDARLRERALGAAEGLTRPEAEARYGPGPAGLAAAGAEPLAALVARVDAVMTELAARHPGEDVVVVSHGAALGHWLRRRAGGFPAAEAVPLVNGAVVTVRREAGAWRYLP